EAGREDRRKHLRGAGARTGSGPDFMESSLRENPGGGSWQRKRQIIQNKLICMGRGEEDGRVYRPAYARDAQFRRQLSCTGGNRQDCEEKRIGCYLYYGSRQ